MKTRLSLFALALCCALPAFAEPEMVILVRHAERGTEPQGDPDLSAAGKARAQALAGALEHAGVTNIITTKFLRTRATAAPLAAARGLSAQVVDTQKGEDHAAAVAAAVKKLNGVVLVVGHSNTVPAIAAALGAPRLPDLCDGSSFSHLWVMQGTRLVRSRYGEPDGEASALGCQ